jgi:chromate reductase, NAD(P)H dehydrogenase (quinone)
MKIVGISGSVREQNFSLQMLKAALKRVQMQCVDVELVDAREFSLALPGLENDKSKQAGAVLKNKIETADGIFIVTPEYHGSYSSVIKLIIDNLGFPSVLKGKPIALIGVAAGRQGAVKALEHLKSVCSHVGAIVVPETLSIAKVHEAFDMHHNLIDAFQENRLNEIVDRLIHFSRILNPDLTSQVACSQEENKPRALVC